jgi:predicted phosphodiesterase
VKTSGLFTVHGHKIPFKYNVPFKIIFFGDVHRDSPDHADGKWQRFLEYAKDQKNAYFFGMGDYLDSTSTSERECLGSISPKMHDTFRKDIELLQMAKIELIAKELSFMKGRIIGMLNGNHYFNFQSGINGDQKLCELLGAKYLGACSFVRLLMQSSGRSVSRDIFAHHGAGAARLVGGSINRVQQMAEGAEADIYAMGHDHKRAAVPAQPRLFLSNTSKHGLKVQQREPVALRTGSFLASFKNGQANYNVDACRPPTSLGHVEVIITVRENREYFNRTTVRHPDDVEMQLLS